MISHLKFQLEKYFHQYEENLPDIQELFISYAFYIFHIEKKAC
ncbi:hypothetical protein L289_2876 [Acinetobacter gerneri DSM 14967 = CIP 107464 = MTCC 9824]|nr:hypothetical protein L289_2876 [Acinetobacter gerneri DSM 14967 = CIP 107464 = MTCC 9824]